jgi:hypothetical protein
VCLDALLGASAAFLFLAVSLMTNDSADPVVNGVDPSTNDAKLVEVDVEVNEEREGRTT